MKKIAIISLSLLCSCSADPVEDDEYELLGDWISETYEISEEIDLEQGVVYTYNSDNTFSMIYVNINPDIQEIVGYTRKELGSYERNGDQLLMRTLKAYKQENSEDLYTSQEELMEFNLVYTRKMRIEFLENGKRLLLIFPPCGPTKSCLTSQELIKFNLKLFGDKNY